MTESRCTVREAVISPQILSSCPSVGYRYSNEQGRRGRQAAKTNPPRGRCGQ